jgi:hypothetical protein
VATAERTIAAMAMGAAARQANTRIVLEVENSSMKLQRRMLSWRDPESRSVAMETDELEQLMCYNRRDLLAILETRKVRYHLLTMLYSVFTAEHASNPVHKAICELAHGMYEAKHAKGDRTKAMQLLVSAQSFLQDADSRELCSTIRASLANHSLGPKVKKQKLTPAEKAALGPLSAAIDVSADTVLRASETIDKDDDGKACSLTDEKLRTLLQAGSFAAGVQDALNAEQEETKEDSNKCCCCMNTQRQILLRPCNHVTSCEACHNETIKTNDRCPACRTVIKEAIRFRCP